MLWRALLGCLAFLGSLGSGIEAKRASVGGFIGCSFALSVCQPGEICVNDDLFGSCQQDSGIGDGYDEYKYRLDLETLQLLESEINRLLAEGYSWHDVYTQCVIGNILLAFRKGSDVDPYWCDQASNYDRLLEEALTEKTDELLDRFLQDYYAENPETASYPEQKKDEFVEIHKYFKDDDEKRAYDTYYNYGAEMPLTTADSGLDYDVALDSLLSQLQPDDLAALRLYLQGVDSNSIDQLSDLDLSLNTRDYDEPNFVDTADDYPALDTNWQEGATPQITSDNYIDPEYAAVNESPISEDIINNGIPETEDLTYDAAPLDSSEVLSEQELEELPVAGESTDSGDLMMSPDDAALLSDLVEERIDISQLSDDEIRRLLKYVDSMLGYIQKEAEEKSENNEVKVLKEEEIKRTGDDDQLVAVKKEQMNDNVMDNPSGNAKIKVISSVSADKRAPALASQIEVPTDMENPDPHDHSWNDPPLNDHTKPPKYEAIDGNYAYVHLRPETNDYVVAEGFVKELEHVLNLPSNSLMFEAVHQGDITFYINPSYVTINATIVASQAMEHAGDLRNATGYSIVNAGIGRETKVSLLTNNGPKYFVLTFVLCGCIAGIVLAVIALYIVRRHAQSKAKVAQLSSSAEGGESSKDYQDLCRQRMQSKSTEKPEPMNAASRVGSVSTSDQGNPNSPSSRSSTSSCPSSGNNSWSEEPVQTNMDISTGHIVLSYMEDHLKNKDRLDEEWEGLVAYDAEPNAITTALEPSNMRKTRYTDIQPYDHSRVVLSSSSNVSGSDYINATTITDHDPRNPAYIATQGPLPHTVADFWQMVWEQGSVVIVMLTKLTENGVAMCHRYWPEEGSDLYHIYEVHLVSEHIWCDDYLVRSFYLKNLQTNETRTVTQFHFLTWPDLGIPGSTKALLDFRRKVNKSYRGRSCPIVVHCSDGVGRTGTYCLVDMVLNRLSKGAKEIDIAATLEHIRDQRMNMVKTKEQFEFALASVAEEVHAILKALPQ